MQDFDGSAARHVGDRKQIRFGPCRALQQQASWLRAAGGASSSKDAFEIRARQINNNLLEVQQNASQAALRNSG